MAHLLKLCLLAILALTGRGLDHTRDASAIAEATATVVADDAEDAMLAKTPEEAAEYAPVFGSYAEDAAVQVYWAFKESSLNLQEKSGDGGKSHGAWQLQSVEGDGSAMAQARAWRKLLKRGAKRCPASPASIMWGDCNVDVVAEGTTSRHAAAHRVERARHLLRLALGLNDPPELAASDFR